MNTRQTPIHPPLPSELLQGPKLIRGGGAGVEEADADIAEALGHLQVARDFGG